MLTLRRRGKHKTFYIRGTIRLGQDRQVVKEHSCGTDRREIAEAYRSRLEADIRRDLLHGPAGRTRTLTISDAGLRYIDRPGGLRSYDILRIDEINAVVGDYSIAQAADAWARYKRERCAGLAPATVQRHRSTFQAMINYLANEEGFDAPKLGRGEKVKVKPAPYLSDDQADRLVASYAEHVQPIATMLRWQGLRIGEAMRLDWAHVRWPREIYVADSKIGEARTVVMHEQTAKALHKIFVARGSPKEGSVFLTQRGLPYRDPRQYRFPSGSPIKKAHATACRRAGIVGFRVHDWRHHWAGRCVMAGIDLETLKAEGGWKSLRMVERYATVSAEHRRDAMAKLK
jgi:integrase